MTGASAITSFHVAIDPDTGAQLAHIVNASNPADHIFNGKVCTILTVPVATYKVSDHVAIDAAIIAAGAAQGIKVLSALRTQPTQSQIDAYVAATGKQPPVTT